MRTGKAIARRTTLLMTPAMLLANATGAMVVFVLAAFVMPSPDVADQDRVLVVNLVAVSIYLPIALLIGGIWGNRRTKGTQDWLCEERLPTEREQRRALREPLRVLLVQAVMWLAAAFGFGALNAAFDPLLGLQVLLTILLGAFTTSAVAYLLGERIYREVAARALGAGSPARPVLPGVTTRATLGWALGSGLPLVGLISVAIAVLSGRDLSDDDMALAILGLAGLGIVGGFLITFLTARGTAGPIVSVRRALAKVEEGDLEAEVPVYDGSELGLLQAGFNTMATGLRERQRMRDLFGRHVGEDVAQAALDEELELGGELREIGALFVDVIGSTALASERPPDEVVSLLNDFFGVVVDVVDSHGGLVNKFEGDAALAVFGAPMAREDYADRALAAGRELGERLAREVSGLSAAVGISGGPAVAGNVGAERRFEYTVIGDPVNEAARLTELAKETPARVLASASLVEHASPEEAAHWELGDSVTLRGRSEETRLAVPGQRQSSGKNSPVSR
jgi:adenylate cyclase